MLFLCRISVGEFFARMTAIQLDAPSVLDAVCDAAADLLALGCSLVSQQLLIQHMPDPCLRMRAEGSS